VAKHLIEKYGRMPIEVAYSSECRYSNAPLNKKTLVLIVSQSEGGICPHPGPKISVASTKAFTAQLFIAAMLALLWAGTFAQIFTISAIQMAKIALFSALPSFLFIYVVRELGPVKANLVDFGQIIIGVVLLNEWKGLTAF
jgi:hypothetical protein